MTTAAQQLRRLVRATILEAVELTAPQRAAKAALDRAAPGAGGKAGVLFARLLSKRIEADEAEQMADEVRQLAQSDARAVQMFDSALDDTRESLAAPGRLGSMIADTLADAGPSKQTSGVRVRPSAAPGAAQPQALSMRSLLKRA
jgi:hypothetical protein